MKRRTALLLTSLVTMPAIANITVKKNKIVCNSEHGIRKVAAMKEFKKVRNLPEGCRTLDMQRKGKIVSGSANKHYVKIKPNTGSAFYTLAKWTR